MIKRITHPIACGRAAAGGLFLPLAGLNFAIKSMVTFSPFYPEAFGKGSL
jgi:hypothetical protein